MANEQLELGFAGDKTSVHVHRTSRRALRAAWWFEHMRRIVSNAMDWEPAPAPRPQQLDMVASLQGRRF